MPKTPWFKKKKEKKRGEGMKTEKKKREKRKEGKMKTEKKGKRPV